MKDRIDTLPVLCMRLKDLQTPYSPSVIRRCYLCNDQVWIDILTSESKHGPCICDLCLLGKLERAK